MDGKKLSQLDEAEAIGDNDLLYLVRNTVESGLVSNKITIATFKELLGGNTGGLPDLIIEPDYNSLDPDDFFLWVQEKLNDPVPDVPTSYTVSIAEPGMLPKDGMVTRFPSMAGCYSLVSGYNSFGDRTHTEAIIYISNDMPGAPRYISHTSVPDIIAGEKGDKGDKGDPGEKGAVTAITRSTTTGNWSSSYGHDLAAEKSHGIIGTTEYWKTHIPLSAIVYGTVPPLDVRLQEIPCAESGEPLPYTLHHQLVAAGAGNPPKLMLMLMVHGTATKLLDLTNGVYGSLGVVDDIRYDPSFMVSYWY